MNKKRKIMILFCMLLISLMVLFFIQKNVYAMTVGTLHGSVTDTPEIKNMSQKVIQIISTIGSILSVIVIIVLGIKYMIGSVEQKAEYKKTLLPYVIGAGFIFAASNIASLIYNFAINI